MEQLYNSQIVISLFVLSKLTHSLSAVFSLYLNLSIYTYQREEVIGHHLLHSILLVELPFMEVENIGATQWKWDAWCCTHGKWDGWCCTQKNWWSCHNPCQFTTDSTGPSTKHHCLVEYEVESCSAATGVTNDGCIDTKSVSLTMPTGGTVIYGVGHQHTGGIGITLYGEDGRVICSSIPTYGEGKEPGNEAGYIVGMSTCYPHPGSVKISDGETLVVISNYSQSNQEHTGVMGLFYILVDDASTPELKPFLEAPVEKHEQMTLPTSLWGVGLFGVAIVVAVGVVAYRRRNENESEEGYQSIVM